MKLKEVLERKTVGQLLDDAKVSDVADEMENVAETVIDTIDRLQEGEPERIHKDYQTGEEKRISPVPALLDPKVLAIDVEVKYRRPAKKNSFPRWFRASYSAAYLKAVAQFIETLDGDFKEQVSELEEAAEDLEGIMFPGMY